MGSILAMDHYQDVFNTGMDGPKVSVVTSLYTVYDGQLFPISYILYTNGVFYRQWFDCRNALQCRHF